jgi:DnaJ-class molecular chaperone
MPTYFRIHPGDEDPASLLDPSRHVCEPWGGSNDGERCDKCGGSGETGFECDSCLVTIADPDCPACGGRVRWLDRCPVCLGHGTVDESDRHGVSVFPRLEGLLRYMERRGTDLSGDHVVELEGERSEDVDFDADEGALLVVPTRIVRAMPVEVVTAPD